MRFEIWKFKILKNEVWNLKTCNSEIWKFENLKFEIWKLEIMKFENCKLEIWKFENMKISSQTGTFENCNWKFENCNLHRTDPQKPHYKISFSAKISKIENSDFFFYKIPP